MAIINPAELDLKEEAVVRINRVAKVTSRGKRFRFSALVVVGDGKGHVGIGLGKANDVMGCISKAKDNAKRNIFRASIETKSEQLTLESSINALSDDKGESASDTHNHRIKNILTDVYKRQYGLNSKVFCLTNIFGPFSDEFNGFIPFIIKKFIDPKK